MHECRYLHLSSDEYPRLFLKQMELDGFYNVAVVWYAGNGWTKASAEYALPLRTAVAPRHHLLLVLLLRPGSRGRGSRGELFQAIRHSHMCSALPVLMQDPCCQHDATEKKLE